MILSCTSILPTFIRIRVPRAKQAKRLLLRIYIYTVSNGYLQYVSELLNEYTFGDYSRLLQEWQRLLNCLPQWFLEDSVTGRNPDEIVRVSENAARGFPEY
jgi:hypothetical protein